MSFHNRMMNIRGKEEPASTAYLDGHRDARHAAAEIALEADARLEAAERLAEALCKSALLCKSRPGCRSVEILFGDDLERAQAAHKALTDFLTPYCAAKEPK